MDVVHALRLSVEDYLAFEERSQIRHEYIGGAIYPMSDDTISYNTIVGNIAAALWTKLRGDPCRVFVENVKLRLEFCRDEVFYYPDVFVSCHPPGVEQMYVQWPTVVFEVLSPSTERIDRREKKMVYQQIATLQEYIIVAQDKPEVAIFRRADGWGGEILTAPESVLILSSINQSLALRDIYEDVF